MYCDNTYGTYASFIDARTECEADIGCGAVSDPGCDDTGTFQLCPTNWNENSCSNCTSCIYPKLGMYLFHYHLDRAISNLKVGKRYFNCIYILLLHYLVIGKEALPVPIYKQPENDTVSINNNNVDMTGTNIIAGNDPRTVMGWWRTNQTDRYNIFECGTPNAGRGETFAFGRWFGSHGQPQYALTVHTWKGGYKDDVSKSETNIGPSDNTWHHFTHVWDGSSHHIYYDGELYSQGPDSNVNLKTVANGCVFGSREQSLNFQGDIKGIEVYAEALNANQIKHILGNLFYFFEPGNPPEQIEQNTH